MTISVTLVFGICNASGDNLGSAVIGYDSIDAYHSGFQKHKSILFGSFPDSTYPTPLDSAPESNAPEKDTLALPDKIVSLSKRDSISKEFKKYWTKVEEESGFDKLREQMRATDVNRSKIPHWYFFDSTLVVFPGWFRIIIP